MVWAENYKPHPITSAIVVLTVAHLGIAKPDGAPGDRGDLADVREANLAALCQRCRLNYDREDNLRRRFLNRRAARLARGRGYYRFGRDGDRYEVLLFVWGDRGRRSLIRLLA